MTTDQPLPVVTVIPGKPLAFGVGRLWRETAVGVLEYAVHEVHYDGHVYQIENSNSGDSTATDLETCELVRLDLSLFIAAGEQQRDEEEKRMR